MKLHRARRDGKTLRLSPEPIEVDDALLAYCVIDEIDREVPAVDGQLKSWEGSDGEYYPHLHYICPRCSTEYNLDLYPDDPNPRFACCDQCRWDSVVWIRWGANS